jgi:uncharacterized protein YjbI with pentapeptide repeats
MVSFYRQLSSGQRQILQTLIAFAGIRSLIALFIAGASLQGLIPFLLSLMVEIVGLGVILWVTIKAFEQSRNQPADKRLQKSLKAELIAQLGSTEKAAATQALKALRQNGWLNDGSLRRAFLAEVNLPGVNLWNVDAQSIVLRNANLQNAELVGADLQRADLVDADLQGAEMGRANLQGADLRRANLHRVGLLKANLQGADLRSANLQAVVFNKACLQGADLRGANMQNAALTDAELQDADLRSANLTGADLSNSNLQGASLESARFDNQTFLPDHSKWSANAELCRFTDPNHPQFWGAPKPKSADYKSG